jgi:hypothetical protein
VPRGWRSGPPKGRRCVARRAAARYPDLPTARRELPGHRASPEPRGAQCRPRRSLRHRGGARRRAVRPCAVEDGALGAPGRRPRRSPRRSTQQGFGSCAQTRRRRAWGSRDPAAPAGHLGGHARPCAWSGGRGVRRVLEARALDPCPLRAGSPQRGSIPHPAHAP